MPTNNYFHETDLNAPGGPISDPQTNPGALHYFGCEARYTEVQNLGPERVFVSFDLSPDSGTGSPPPTFPRVHAVIDPGQIAMFTDAPRYHVLVWRDPTAPAPVGPEPVRVRAWA